MIIIREVMENDFEYEKAKERIKKKMEHGNLLNGSYCEDVDVKLGLPEMNAVNTTIFCDRLIAKYGCGCMFLHTEIDCISQLNIEYQSSGFHLFDTIKEADMEMLVLRADPAFIKPNLFIPKKWETGFTWCPTVQKYRIIYKPHNVPFVEEPHFKKVPTSQYGHNYILNFSVSGEFGLDIYYLPEEGEEPMLIFSKSYCCK